MADLPKLDVVIANNFGHLPMFIGAEKGFFKAQGVDAKFKVVDTGTDMVNALHDGRSEEHTSELQSLMRISYAVFCLKKKNNNERLTHTHQQKKHTTII